MTATGGPHRQDYSKAVLYYYDATGSLTPVGRTLRETNTTYSAPTVPASTYLYHGRQIWWLVMAFQENWYDVVQFHVVWTYYVLA